MDGGVVGVGEEGFEGFHAEGVEGGAGVFGDDVHDLFVGKILTVGAFGGECFEHVGNAEDACFERKL